MGEYLAQGSWHLIPKQRWVSHQDTTLCARVSKMPKFNLGDIILSEKSSHRQLVRFHIYEVPRVDKLIETESGRVVAKG